MKFQIENEMRSNKETDKSKTAAACATNKLRNKIKERVKSGS